MPFQGLGYKSAGGLKATGLFDGFSPGIRMFLVRKLAKRCKADEFFAVWATRTVSGVGYERPHALGAISSTKRAALPIVSLPLFRSSNLAQPLRPVTRHAVTPFRG